MVNKSDILSQTRNGLDVLRHYLGHNVTVGRKFRNPFYHDTNPSCYIYYDRRSGVYRYKDFGNEQYAGDCFDLVARIHNLSPADPRAFGEVLRIIDRDLNLGLEDRPLSLSQRTLARQRHPPRGNYMDGTSFTESFSTAKRVVLLRWKGIVSNR